ncbi:hypothetical protein HK096_000434, partial [Nowakowskiella sp. JEL0078]
MDVWGTGCVLFEIVSKVPLFPGSNELDQIHRIHNIMGTPSPKVLKHMLGNKASSMKYNFPQREATGIRPLIQHVSNECVDLINLLLAYDPDERITSKEALKHSFFKDIHLFITELGESYLESGEDPQQNSSYLKQPATRNAADNPTAIISDDHEVVTMTLTASATVVEGYHIPAVQNNVSIENQTNALDSQATKVAPSEDNYVYESGENIDEIINIEKEKNNENLKDLVKEKFVDIETPTILVEKNDVSRENNKKDENLQKDQIIDDEEP